MPPSASRDAAVRAVDALASALGRVGDGLARFDAPALAEAESTLASALASVSAVRSSADRDAVIAAVGRARIALLRCRRLGVSFMNVARAGQAGSADSYTRAGGYLDATGSSSLLNARL